MRKLILAGLMLLAVSISFAQNSKKERREANRNRINAMVKQEEDGIVAYQKSMAIGGKLINDGYGVFFELGRAKSVNKATLYQLELSERKHPKEEKQSNLFNYSTPFIFGKENFFYPIKLGIQQQMLFGNKGNKNGVSVTYNYGGGVALGLLRPYYVQLGATGNYVKYQSSDSADFLNPAAISAGPGFNKGWSDIQMKPGLYIKGALRFDYGSYNEMISAIEVGVSGEFYSQKIPIMVHTEPKQFFFTGFVAIMFGRRK